MSLANLSINVNVNAPNAERSLQRIGDQAAASMSQSGAAVQGFERQLQTSASTLQDASQRMGGSMATAAQQIQQSADKAQVAIEQLNDAPDSSKFEAYGHQIAVSVGAGFGAGYAAAQTWLQKTEDYVVEKGKIIAIGLAAGALVAGGGAIYAAYRIIKGSLDFVEGLFTGASYKSADIDALSAQLGKVKDLQAQLHLTAQEANAFDDAMNRLGVSKGDVIAGFNGASTAMRNNGDELKRLGITYQNEDGTFLTQRDVLQNAKRALDEYTEGYDRNAAAAAIGMGTYEQINAALKINQAEVQASKQRLDEFNLGIGEDALKAESAYQQAMREFRNETKLTGEGFSRVWADALLPVLTNLAVYFKDGFPSAVQAFRVGVSTVTGLLYAMADGAYIVFEAVRGSVKSAALALLGFGSAVSLALTGNFQGAKDALLSGLDNAADRFKRIGSNIVDVVMSNDAAISLAVGDDDRKSGRLGGPGSAAKKGKAFVGRPEAPAQAASTKRSAYAAFLEDLDRQNKKVAESEYAMLRLKAAELAAADSITDLSGAFQRINDLQRGDSQKAAEEFATKLQLENDAFAEQTVMLTMSGAALEMYQAKQKATLAAEDAIRAARKSGKPLDQQAIDAVRESARVQSDAAAKLIADRNVQERAAATGIRNTLATYYSGATNAATAAAALVTGALQRAEDAFVNFAKTGKLSLGDLFGYMAEEYLRQLFRMAVAKTALDEKGNLLSFSTIFSNVAGFFGGGKASGGPVTGGTTYLVGEQGPELFVPGSGGSIVPNHALASGGGPTIDASINGLSVGAGVSLAQVHGVVNQAVVAMQQQIFRSLGQRGAPA